MSTTTIRKKKPINELWLEVIKERGIKQSWVAEKAGISDTHVSNVLYGKCTITQNVADAMNKALGTDFKL